MKTWGNEWGEEVVVEVGSIGSWQEAGQKLADESGCVYVYGGQSTSDTQDCECAEPLESCPDSEDGTGPCVFRKGVPVWRFAEYMEPGDDTDTDIRYSGVDPLGEMVFRPKSAAYAGPSPFGVKGGE